MSDVVHKSLHHAKLAVMEDVDYLQKKIPKSGLNYAILGEEQIVDAMHAAFLKHRLTVSVIKIEIHKNDTFTTTKGAAQNHTVILSTFRLTHADSGQSEESMAIGEGMDVGDKSANKASTGAYKYFFRQAFMIPSGNDPDRTPSQEQERQSPAQTQRPPKGEKQMLFEQALKDVQEAQDAKLLFQIEGWARKQGFAEKDLIELELAIGARRKSL